MGLYKYRLKCLKCMYRGQKPALVPVFGQTLFQTLFKRAFEIAFDTLKAWTRGNSPAGSA